MKYGLFTYINIFYLGWQSLALAIAPADYADRFKIDLDEPLPSLTELREQFRPAKVYDRKYDFYWNIGDKFDKVFAQTIRSYGTRERRIKWQGEDELYEMIKSLPPETYEYIGPYLHSVPGIPEKILNMPGIKETKNQFPKRIAPQLADIENLEMLSPYLYFLLMPEIWRENRDPDEVVMPQSLPEPTNRYNAKLIDDIAQIVLPQNFIEGKQQKAKLSSQLRTVKPTTTSPLTSPDITAFMASLNDLDGFAGDLKSQSRLSEAEGLLDKWDDARGQGTGVPLLKGLVMPCARLVQKIRLTGMENDFQNIIAPHGFSVKEWAYTCDKTIKAYRLLNMTKVERLVISLYRQNSYEDQLNVYDHKYGPIIAATMQSMVERYKAPLSDMLEVKKNYRLIRDYLRKHKRRIADQHIYMR